MHVSPSTGPGDILDPVSIPKVIPLFPLPNLVFFPRTYVPLHIFEPRYREMVQAAAATHRMVGMVLLKEGWEADYGGAPAIFAMGCVGRMMNVQRLSDGRSNILLQGLRRFEIQHEVGAESYRQGRIVLNDLFQPDAALPPEIRREIVKVVAGFIRNREDGMALSAMLKQPIHDDVLVQNLSFALDFTPLEKQFLLESDSLIQQGRRLLDLLHFKLHERHEQTRWS
ncbi:MAG: LON peptidase substrate-binding domain-containing protein [Nitrospirota bacterium]